MKLKYIFLAVFCLAALITCQESQEESQTSTEAIEGDDPSKFVNKRNSLLPTNADGSLQENGVGFNSIFIQVLAGVLQGALNGKGVSTENINTIGNLLNPEKILNDLNLFRRFLNLSLRLLNSVMGILPFTASGFNPVKSLSSKFAFYAVQPTNDSTQIITYNDGKAMLQPYIPDRVETLVEYVTHRAEQISSTTQAPPVEFEDISTEVRQGSFGAVQYQPEQTTTTTTTTTTTQTPTTTTTTTEKQTVEVSHVYGLPSPQAPPKSPQPVYGVPNIDTRMNFNDDKPMDQELPLMRSNDDFNDLPLQVYGLPVPHKEYGAPRNMQEHPFMSEERRRDKSGLPFQGESEVFAGLPHFGRESRFLNNDVDSDFGNFHRDSTKKGDLNFETIADLPLEQDTERKDGDLRDSFGSPIPN